jgi:hypothetical protein
MYTRLSATAKHDFFDDVDVLRTPLPLPLHRRRTPFGFVT